MAAIPPPHIIPGSSENINFIVKNLSRVLSTVAPKPDALNQDTPTDITVPQSSNWPQEACEWITRPRLHDWPSQTTQESVIQDGCYVFPAANSQSLTKPLENRFSFAKAEDKLFDSLTDTQRECYKLLELIHDTHLKHFSVLEIVHLKHTLLWTFEQCPISLWTMDRIGECLLLLLDNLFHFLATGNLPNYFIPESNMLDSVASEHLNSVVKIVASICRQPWKYLLSLQSFHSLTCEQSYDLCQNCLDGMGLKRSSHNVNHSQGFDLLDQLLEPVVAQTIKGINDNSTRLWCSVGFALVLVVASDINDSEQGTNGSSLPVFQSFQDVVSQMSNLGALPDNFTEEDCVPFMVRLLVLMCHSVPDFQVKDVARSVLRFLDSAQNTLGVISIDDHSCIWPDFLYLSCLDYGMSLTKQDAEEIRFCEERIQSLTDAGVCITEHNIACDVILALLYAKVEKLKQSSSLWINLLDCEELQDFEICLETLHNFWTRQEVFGYTYETKDALELLSFVANTTIDEDSTSSKTLSILVDRQTCSTLLYNICEENGGCLTVPLSFLCLFGLLSSDPHHEKLPEFVAICFEMDNVTSKLCLADVLQRIGGNVYGRKLLKSLSNVSPSVFVALQLCEVSISIGDMYQQSRFSLDKEIEDKLMSFTERKIDINAEHLSDVQATTNGIIPHLRKPLDEVIVLEHLAGCSINELQELATCYIKAPPNQESHVGLSQIYGLCLGRMLHAQIKQEQGQHSEHQLLKTKAVLEKAVQESGGKAKFVMHYLNFFRQEDMKLELLMGLEILESKLKETEEISGMLVFHASEGPVSPEFLRDSFGFVRTISLPVLVYLKYLYAVCLKPEPSLEGMCSDNSCLDKVNVLPNWLDQLQKGLVKEINGLYCAKRAELDNAKESSVKTCQLYPGEYQRHQTGIRECDDIAVKNAMALVVQEKYEEAYDAYSQVWNSRTLSRCSQSCSKVLHLSEELRKQELDNERVLRTCALFLQYALLQEDNIHMADGHKAHVLCTLALFYYKMYKSSSLGNEENYDSCLQCLKSSAELSESGAVYTLLGNVHFLNDSFEDSVFLGKAIAKGSVQAVSCDTCVLHSEVRNPHHLVTETRKYHSGIFLPTEPLFSLLTHTMDEHYDSYLVYALYLEILCKMKLDIDTDQAMTQMCTVISDKIGKCNGKYSLFGILCLMKKDYKNASEFFLKELEMSEAEGSVNKQLLYQLSILAGCALILSPMDEDCAKEIADSWLEKVSSAACANTDLKMSKETLSLAEFFSDQLADVFLCYQANPLFNDTMLDVFLFLHKELETRDEASDGLFTNIAIFMHKKYTELDDTAERSQLALQLDDAFQKALSVQGDHWTITRSAYANFLLKERRFDECIDQANQCRTVAFQNISTLLQDLRESDQNDALSDNELQQLRFYLHKSLTPACDLLVMAHALKGSFEGIFEVTDMVLATLRRVEHMDIDPLAYLMKFTLDLTTYQLTMDSVVAFYEAVLQRYPDSEFLASMHGNLACMLFSFARSQHDIPDNDDEEEKSAKLLEQAKRNFENALDSSGVSLATYADFANFLVNTGDFEGALLVICRADTLRDNAKGYNVYCWEERFCVGECMRGLIEKNSKVKCNSRIYCQYLRVKIFIALQRGNDVVASEIEVFKETINEEIEEEEDDDEIYDVMYEELRTELTKMCENL